MIRRLFLLALTTAVAVLPQTAPTKAKRIVSTAPSITEALFALGLGDEVVGVSDYCHYPPEADKKARIGKILNPDVEAIIALHPDLVVVLQGPNHLQEQLQRLHIRSIPVEQNTIEDVLQSDDSIARAAGVPEAGPRLNSQVKQSLDQVRTKTAHLPKLKAVFVIGHSPGKLAGFFVAGKGTYFSELLGIAGAENAFDDAKGRYPQVSLEEILGRNPDVIVETTGAGPEKKTELLQLWSSEPHLRAVQTHHVFAVPDDLFDVPGPRIGEMAHDLAHVLHPEAGL